MIAEHIRRIGNGDRAGTQLSGRPHGHGDLAVPGLVWAGRTRDGAALRAAAPVASVPELRSGNARLE